MTARRTVMATWIVDGLSRLTPLRDGCSRREAIGTIWLLMDPAIFDRLTRQRHWNLDQYKTWLAQSALRLLTEQATCPTKETT